MKGEKRGSEEGGHRERCGECRLEVVDETVLKEVSGLAICGRVYQSPSRKTMEKEKSNAP